MRALEFITGHVIYNPAYTSSQLKTTLVRNTNKYDMREGGDGVKIGAS